MDVTQKEARFVEQARRGSSAWRTRQRWALYLVVLPLFWMLPAGWALATAPDTEAVLGATIRLLSGLAFLAFGWAMWQHARVMEGAALQLERHDAPPA
jgi:hypothetical protein